MHAWKYGIISNYNVFNFNAPILKKGYYGNTSVKMSRYKTFSSNINLLTVYIIVLQITKISLTDIKMFTF